MIQTVRRSIKRLLGSLGLASVVLAAGCGGGDQGRDPILGLPAATLVSVAVSPTNASVAIGAVQQFTATAAYSDGSARDVSRLSAWTSATPAAGTVNAGTGLATGVAPGTTVIAAIFEGKRGTSTLTVLPAKLVSIAIAPVNPSINIGDAQQFVALGTFDNNTTRDISALSTFTSASTGVATISASGGLALGRAAGNSRISAESGGLSGSTMLTVLPPTLAALALTPATTTFEIGATRQLTASATYSDGTVVDVTGTSSYLSALPGAVGVDARGVITGIAAGTARITASFGGLSATASATTLAGVTLTSIAVTPATATVLIDGSRDFIATATYSNSTTADITSTAAWTSSATGIATVLPTGRATGVARGSAILTATAFGKSGSATLTVRAPRPPVVVVPPAPAIDPVDLGSAATFAVLAGTSLTNNAGGTTFVTGDVGSPSQTTPPDVAPGFTNYTAGPVLQAALDDLQLAIVDANSRLCTVSQAGNAELGGLTLAPGVYCYSGNINVTGTLTLNGPGVYIFRSGLTLDTVANAQISLIGGATADNVTWVPVGATTLGANGSFQGSILGQAAAITVGDMTTLLNGRVLSAVAVTLRNNPITK